MTGFEFFKIYTPLKLHFTQESYDGFKYKWQTRAISNDGFCARKDRFLFEKWGKQHKNSISAGQLVISNFIYNSANWLYDDMQDAQDVYTKWKSVRESITKTFEDDLNELNAHKLLWDQCISRTPKGNAAPLLQLYLAKRIHPESVVISDNINSFIDRWANEYNLDPLIKDEMVKLKKYVPFVKFDRDKVQEKFTSLFREENEKN
jgi:hypothetical protein